jgi:hypothetical protein
VRNRAESAQRRRHRRRSLAITIAIAFCCTFPAGCKKASADAAIAAKPQAKPDNSPAGKLRAIGEQVVAAVMARDTHALLQFDSNPEDQLSLSDNKSELYCYLFDSACISGENKRAIYDLFATVPKLGIDASSTTLQGKNYGLLMFYDKSQISDTELYTPGFLCTEKGMKNTASWRFVEADGKWSTSTLFEYKTERPCKK